MGKKRKMEIYKRGMKDGVAPFEKKYEETAKQIEKTSRHMDKIARNQRKTNKTISTLIDGEQQNQQKIQDLDKKIAKGEKKYRKNKQKIQNIELKMPSISTFCEKCGHPIESHQLVCSFCGSKSKSFPYELLDFDIEKTCMAEVEELSKIIQESNANDDDWVYEELNDKFLKMKKIKNISDKVVKEKGKKNAPTYTKISEISQKFFSDYQNKRIEIAVVGNVKAGKSSLINALIGTRLASVDPIPETSILTKYHTTGEENYLKINFYTKAEWDELWSDAKNSKVFRSQYDSLGAEDIKYEYLNKSQKYIKCSLKELPRIMMEWSKSDSPKHFFVKEIEVGYQSNTIPNDVFLVDTPGLSDPVKYRSNITRKYIKNSDWILACISGENLSSQYEFNFLSKVISNKGGDVSKIFVVATKKDALGSEAVKKKRDEFLIRLGQLYDNESMAVSRFAFVAAEIHLLTAQIIHGIVLESEERRMVKRALVEIDEDLSFEDVNDKYDEIFKYAGINELFERINKVVLINRRKYIINEIKEDYIKCMRVINENATMDLDDLKAYLKKLTEDKEQDQSQIDEIEKINCEIEILQGKIKEIRKELEIKIRIDSDYVNTK